MIRRSQTAVLEKNTTFTANFETEPYEAGWASEARWFVQIVSIDGLAVVHPQISPDGLHWCDERRDSALRCDQPGLYSFALRDFGAWLRLRVALQGTVKVMIYLSLKE